MKKADSLNNDLEDYFRIRFENKIAIRPRREDCVLAASTRLLAKKHELEQVSKEVERCQGWYKGRMEQIATQREEIEERERGLKNQLIKFEKFIYENDSKRHRGLAKIKEEQQHQAAKDSELAKLDEEFQHLEHVKSQIQSGVDRNKAFGEFLLKATELSDDYEEINDILSRCELLRATKQYLDKRGQKDTNAVKEQLSNMIQYMENRSTETLRLNNLMSELQTRYDQAQRDVINSERNWTRIKNTAAKKTLLLGQIKMAIHNLYQLCYRYHQARVLDQEEVVIYKEPFDQLRMIREIMEDIVAVYRRCMHSNKHASLY